MAKVTIYYDTDEEYPYYIVREERTASLLPVEIDEDDMPVVRAYEEAVGKYHDAKDALIDVLERAGK